MALKHQYATQEEIPEAYRDLFTEKAGKWEITGIEGLKSQADVDRVTGALSKERTEHKATKGKLAVWGELDHDATQKKLDRIPELEAASKGKFDEEAIERAVASRVEGTIKSRLSPVERQLKKATDENATLKTENTGLKATATKRSLGDALDPLLLAAKVRPEHYEDAKMYAERHFELQDDGSFVTKDQVGVTPGVGPKDWLDEFLPKRPGWVPESVGSGAPGSGGGGGGGGDNPFSHAHWNMTQQGQFIQKHGMEKATAKAKAAGTTIGGPRPAAPK